MNPMNSVNIGSQLAGSSTANNSDFLSQMEMINQAKSEPAGQGVNFGAQGSSGTANSALAVPLKNSQSGPQVSGDQDSTNAITQLLNALIQLLQGQGKTGDSGKSASEASDGSNASANGPTATQNEQGSSDMLTQLMDMIKKMLGQSSEGSDSAGQSANGDSAAAPASAQSSNGTEDSGSESNGIAGKLGAALQMLGLGAILSALQGSGASAQGSGDVSK
ncbi:hypothetical protein [Erwinia tasmaniensis]|uniref:hypothetical protein n=1 Tax=Erwinia tasmaniensis TaxID=338565 RepID=UPI003A4D3836